MNQQHDPPLNLFKYAMIPFYLLFHFNSSLKIRQA